MVTKKPPQLVSVRCEERAAAAHQQVVLLIAAAALLCGSHLSRKPMASHGDLAACCGGRGTIQQDRPITAESPLFP